MDEPLVCWIFLLIAMVWAARASGGQHQHWLKTKFGKCRHIFQWYNVTFALLTYLFLRTVLDIVHFEYIKDHFLSWSVYKETLNPNKTGIPLTPEEMDIHQGPLVLPSWIRFLSLFSLIPGLGAFGYSVYQVVIRIVNDTEEENAKGKFLHMVVLGMPLVYIVMALRATIRQWAVMTGSCWLPYSHMEMAEDDRKLLWKSLKAAEISTYSQDLEVASGFQFFAVWCFGQVCSKALRNVILDGNAREISSDASILLQLGIFGLHAFVILGVVKTVFNMAMAIASSDWELEAALEPIQQTFLQTFDPVFLFATILSVINMMLLAKMDRVAEVLPNVNMKFNATRALLLIGQGQLTILRAACTDGASGTSKVLKMLHKIPFGPFKEINWWFGINQARLVHSSLLCFECFLVVVINSITWQPKVAIAREASAQGGTGHEPLLDAEAREREEQHRGPLLAVDSA